MSVASCITIGDKRSRKETLMQSTARNLYPYIQEAPKPEFKVIEGGLNKHIENIETQSIVEPKTNKTSKAAFIGIVTFMVLVFGISAISDNIHHKQILDNFMASKPITINVMRGDSLWSIASSYPIEGATTQEVVSSIIEVNELSSTNLHPGQHIVVPGIYLQ